MNSKKKIGKLPRPRLMKTRIYRAAVSQSLRNTDVEVSATGWSLVQRSPIVCGVSECDSKTSTIQSPLPTRGCRTNKNKICKITSLSSTQGLTHQFTDTKKRVSEARSLNSSSTEYAEAITEYRAVCLTSVTTSLSGFFVPNDTPGSSCIL